MGLYATFNYFSFLFYKKTLPLFSRTGHKTGKVGKKSQKIILKKVKKRRSIRCELVKIIHRKGDFHRNMLPAQCHFIFFFFTVIEVSLTLLFDSTNDLYIVGRTIYT